MELVINQLASISKQKKLIPAELILMPILSQFLETQESEIEKINFKQIEEYLMNILLINNGNLSLQCSIEIGNCFIHLYRTDHTPEALYNFVQSHLVQSAIICAGKVISHYSNSPPSLLSHLLLQKDLFPSLFCINKILSSDPSQFTLFQEKLFSYLRKSLHSGIDEVSILAIEVIRTIIRTQPALNSSIFPLVVESFENAASPFLHEYSSYAVAESAFYGAFREGVLNLNVSFSQISTCFNETVLKHFLTVVPPKVLYDQMDGIFKMVRPLSRKATSLLVPYMSRDQRVGFFNDVISEQKNAVNQITVARDLAHFSEMEQLANLACTFLSLSKNECRRYGAMTLMSMYNDHPAIVEPYVYSSLEILAKSKSAPEQTIRGCSLLLAHILSVNPTVLSLHNDLLQHFLHRGLKSDVFNVTFSCAFEIMALLDKKQIPVELTKSAIHKFITMVERSPNMSEHPAKQLRHVTKCLASFIRFHPDFEGGKQFVWFASSLTSLHSYHTLYCVFDAVPQIVGNTAQMSSIATVLIDKIFDSQYTLPIVNSKVAKTAKMSKFLFSVIHSHIEKYAFLQHVVDCFADFVSAMRKDEAKDLVRKIGKMTKNLELSQSLILTLLMDNRTFPLFDDGIYENLMRCIDENEPNRALVTVRCIAILCEKKPKFLQKVLNHCAMKTKVNSSLMLISAICHEVHLTNDHIIELMHLLDEAVKTPKILTQSLRAMAELYSCYAVQLSGMQLSITQLNVLLTILNSRPSLSPLNLLFFVECFSNILSIFSPEIHTQNSTIIPIIKTIIYTLRLTDVPFAEANFFRAIKSVVTFADDCADQTMMKFPESVGGRLAACNAYADFFRMKSGIELKVPNMKLLWLLLQSTGDHRVSDCLVGLLSNSENDQMALSAAKQALIDGKVPEIEPPFEAGIPVKKCVLQALLSVGPEKCQEAFLAAVHEEELTELVYKGLVIWNDKAVEIALHRNYEVTGHYLSLLDFSSHSDFIKSHIDLSFSSSIFAGVKLSEKIDSLLEIVTPIIHEAMSIFMTETPDFLKTASFRSKYDDYFANLLSYFVKFSEEDICHFLIYCLEKKSDRLRNLAAFEALTILIESGQKIDILETVLRSTVCVKSPVFLRYLRVVWDRSQEMFDKACFISPEVFSFISSDFEFDSSLFLEKCMRLPNAAEFCRVLFNLKKDNSLGFAKQILTSECDKIELLSLISDKSVFENIEEEIGQLIWSDMCKGLPLLVKIIIAEPALGLRIFTKDNLSDLVKNVVQNEESCSYILWILSSIMTKGAIKTSVLIGWVGAQKWKSNSTITKAYQKIIEKAKTIDIDAFHAAIARTNNK